MKVRFGYVAHAMELWDASPSKTLTFKRYQTLPKNERLEKLQAVTADNLLHTKRILHYNIAHDIKLYRFSSALVPLATHPEVMWDFVAPFQKEWKELGILIRKNRIRPSFHPGQFTLFTSPREDVTSQAVLNMEYHYRMLEAMDVSDAAIMNIHIGGAYGDKNKTLERFHVNLRKIPSQIKHKMTLENDDKTYNVEETLLTCKKAKVPMVLDYHHHMANPTENELLQYLPRIFNTWDDFNQVPKVHISSPKSDQAYRSHADYVSLDFILPFIKMVKELDRDVDMMVEAKQKSLAMHRLVEELASIRGVKRIGGATLEF